VPEFEGDEPVVIGEPRDDKPFTLHKTHGLYRSDYPKVIYLLRDGRDVYVSYYFYLLNRVKGITSFAEFLRNPGFYPNHWSQHCASWLHGPERDNMLVVRYEDLKADTFNQFRKMVDFAGLEVSDEALEEAIQCSSFDQMKKAETEFGRPFKSAAEAKVANPFMRKGAVGDWHQHFGEEELRVFKEINNDMLIELGYVDDDAW
jgi:hypothetical protein